MLASCQPPTFDIFAHGTVRHLVFTARGSGIWLLRSDDNIDANEVSLRDRDRIVWKIERNGDESCKPEGISYPFPLTYGRLPKCFRQVVAPAALSTGRLYRVDSDGFRSGMGLFRVVEQPQSLEWDDVAAEINGWPALEAPVLPALENAN